MILIHGLKYFQFHQNISMFILGAGVCWQLLPGGGCVVGDVDSLGEHSGDNIAYIYPDLSTALLGTFHQGELVR